MENRDSARSFSFVVSSLVLIYHAAAAYLCTYLPSDPLYVSISVTGYAWYGCVLSVLGIAGSIKQSPILLTIFSNHLLIDTVLSLVPKIGLLYLFHDLTADVCMTSLSTTFWVPSQDSSLHGPGRPMLQAPDRIGDRLADAVTSRRRCDLGVSVAQVVFLAVLVLWTTAQWGFGLYIRRYAVKLDIANTMSDRKQPAEVRDVEKAFYEEDSLADGYFDAVESVKQWTWNGNEKEALFGMSHGAGYEKK